MNTETPIAPATNVNDLVLRFVGGKRDGETVSITTTRCMLGLSNRNETDTDATPRKCAIYRGVNGVAVQSHGTEVLVNGAAKSVHWLQEGDQIQLTNSQAVEVVQLGSVESENSIPVPVETTPPAFEEPAATEFTTPTTATYQTAPTEQFDSHSDAPLPDYSGIVAGDRLDFVSGLGEASTGSASIADDAGVDSTGGDSEVNQRFEALESTLDEIRGETANVNDRFNRLEGSIDALTTQLERLASQALNPQSFSDDQTAAFVEPATTEAQPTDATTEAAPAAFIEDASLNSTAAPTPESDQADDYPNSIASLFSELANDSPNASTADVEPETPAREPANTESVSDIFARLQTGGTASEGLDALGAPVTEAAGVTESEPTPEEPASYFDNAAATTTEDVSAESPVVAEPVPVTVEPAAETREPAKTESVDDILSRLQSGGSASEGLDALGAPIEESQTGQEPAFSSEEPASYFDTPAATVEEAVVAESPIAAEPTAVTPEPALAVRAPANTESVADIFARLQNAQNEQPSGNADSSTAAPVLRAKEPTLADIEASISADFAEAENVTAAQVVEAEAVEAEVAVAAEPGETPKPPADDVASVMARLRSQMNMDDDSEEESVQAATVETDSTADPETVSATPVAKEATGDANDDSVEDYMSMLLTRMRGGESDSGDEKVTATETPTPVTTEEVKSTFGAAESDSDTDDAKLTAEEFKPRRKAAPIKSFDKMRELANSTTRSAIQRSISTQKKQRSRNLILQSLTLGSLALAGLMVWSKAYIPAAAFAAIFALAIGYMIYEPTQASPKGPGKARKNVKDDPADNEQAAEAE